MKRLVLFLGLILVFNNTVAMTVTASQAASVVEAATPTASASSFFGLLPSSTIANITATDFTSYYAAYFINFSTSGTYQLILNNYLNDIATFNYAQAQIDLIRLTAATLKNSNKTFIFSLIQAASSPWGAGKFLTLSSVGTLDQQLVQFFVNQFAILYPKIPVSSNPSSNAGSVAVVPLNPANKVTDPNDAMQLEETNDNGAMSDLAASGVQAINNAQTALTLAMNNIQSQALADTTIGTDATNQKYLSDLSSTVSNGLVNGNSVPPSMQTINSNYSSQILAVKNTGINNLNILVAQGGSPSMASVYINNLNSNYLLCVSQLNTALSNSTAAIENLQKEITTAISAKAVSSGGSTGGGGLSTDVLKDLLEVVVGTVSTATAGIILYLGKLALCSFGYWPKCPPTLDSTTQDLLEKFNLPTDLKGFMAKVGAVTNVDFLNLSVTLRNAVITELSGQLSLTSDQVNSLIGENTGANLSDFITKVESVYTSVTSTNSEFNSTDIYNNIGQALLANPSASVDTLVANVQSAMSTGSITPANPTGGDTPNPGAGSEVQPPLPTDSFTQLQDKAAVGIAKITQLSDQDFQTLRQIIEQQITTAQDNAADVATLQENIAQYDAQVASRNAAAAEKGIDEPPYEPILDF